MTAAATDWHAVATAKLTHVLGEERGRQLLASTLATTGLTALTSADELHRFAQALVEAGGFAGAVGGLLSLHAVMHGARGRFTPPSKR